ncbi:MAG TPA: hypothetical protein VIO43_00005 [Lutibacter sp.]
MAEKEKTEKFTNEEAIELVERFKVLVGKYKMKNGYLIQRLFAIPTRDYLRYEKQMGFEYIWKILESCDNDTLSDVDYDVVVLHRVSENEFYWSNDVTYLEELFCQHSKLHQADNLDYPL